MSAIVMRKHHTRTQKLYPILRKRADAFKTVRSVDVRASDKHITTFLTQRLIKTHV